MSIGRRNAKRCTYNGTYRAIVDLTRVDVKTKLEHEVFRYRLL